MILDILLLIVLWYFVIAFYVFLWAYCWQLLDYYLPIGTKPLPYYHPFSMLTILDTLIMALLWLVFAAMYTVSTYKYICDFFKCKVKK